MRDADVFAELIPDSRKAVFEDTGHMAMLERPQAFNALLEEFLASSARSEAAGGKRPARPPSGSSA